MTKNRLYDYKLGRVDNPDLGLAQAVGISSAFPPVLSPVQVDMSDAEWTRTDYAFLHDEPGMRSKLFLTDGGLYDNMGLEAVWDDDFDYVFVCDAGGPFKAQSKIRTNWAGQLSRMTAVMIDQQRALRKRELIARYQELDESGLRKWYGGTYFGISTNINDYELPDQMVSDNKVTESLAHIRTRLNAFTAEEQGRLINWGYALADTAVRKWSPQILSPALNKPGDFPCPDFLLG